MYKLFWSFWAILTLSAAFACMIAAIYTVFNTGFKGTSGYSMGMFCFLWSGLSSIRLRNQ